MSRSYSRALVIVAGAMVALAGAALGGEVPKWFEGGARPLTVGALPSGLGPTAASCEPCHAAIVAEWRGSLHAASWTEPVFQAAYVREPLSFCRNCHAPMNEGKTPRGLAAREGVSCVTCHVRDGEILGGAGVAAAAPGLHPVRKGVTNDSAFCAPCHEFGFHMDDVETAELQQSTMSEWRERLADGRTLKSCQDCHMQSVDGHKRHTFAVRREPGAIAKALDVDVSIYGTTLVVTVKARDVGHAVPTGDQYRRLELRVRVAGRSHVLVYARTFGDRKGPSGANERYEVADTRVGEGPDKRVIELSEARSGAEVHWTLDYLLMPESVARENEVDPAVNVTRLYEGTLTVPYPASNRDWGGRLK